MKPIFTPLPLVAVGLAAFLVSGGAFVRDCRAMENEPGGFGHAKFGMSPAEVESSYEGSIRRLDKENLGAAPVYGPLIVRQVLTDQNLPGLANPTNVELRYWKDHLWVVIVYYGSNAPSAVRESLEKQLGKPDISGEDEVWRSAKVQVYTAARERWYAIADNALSAEAQRAFMEDLARSRERQRQSAGATPANPPAAK